MVKFNFTSRKKHLLNLFYSIPTRNRIVSVARCRCGNRHNLKLKKFPKFSTNHYKNESLKTTYTKYKWYYFRQSRRSRGQYFRRLRSCCVRRFWADIFDLFRGYKSIFSTSLRGYSQYFRRFKVALFKLYFSISSYLRVKRLRLSTRISSTEQLWS